MAKKSGLGKGLGALIRDLPTEPADNIRIVEISKIVPRQDQPRKLFDESLLNELAESIKKHGVLQPIILRQDGEKYEIIAGERRFRAAQLAGLKDIPSIIKMADESTVREISIVENIQRENLNPIEEASAYKQLLEQENLTQEQLATKVGKSRSYIANTLRLLNLEEETKQYMMDGRLTANQGRTLLSISDPKKRKSYLDKLLEKKTNIREIEKLSKKSIKSERDIFLMELEDELGESLSTKVKLLPKKKGGKIEIEYYNDEDLERLYEILKEV